MTCADFAALAILAAAELPLLELAPALPYWLLLQLQTFPLPCWPWLQLRLPLCRIGTACRCKSSFAVLDLVAVAGGAHMGFPIGNAVLKLGAGKVG